MTYEPSEAELHAAFLAARQLGKSLDDDVLRAVLKAAHGFSAAHKPKRGDKFVHARYLAKGASAWTAESDEKYETFVVTAIRGGYVHYTGLDGRGHLKFRLDDQAKSVRRWL